MKKYITRALLSLACLLVLVPASDAARPRVDIAPTRLVVEGRDRSAELTIANVFSDEGTYRVEILNNRMKPEGGYQRLDGPLDAIFDPEQNIRVSPRQFSLKPQEIQRIRLSVRRPADLPAGDYRFHVLVIRLANVQNPGDKDVKGKALKLGTNIGVSIPVVIRQGTYDSDIVIENAQILGASENQFNIPMATMDLRRTSAYDVFGSIHIVWEPQGGEPRKIGLLNNLNVFHEIESRKVGVKLSEFPQGPGKIYFQYVEDYYDQGVIDEVILQR